MSAGLGSESSSNNSTPAANDKNALLASASFTKSSTSEESSDPGSDRGRHLLPPAYVDINEEIDSTMKDISLKSK